MVSNGAIGRMGAMGRVRRGQSVRSEVAKRTYARHCFAGFWSPDPMHALARHPALRLSQGWGSCVWCPRNSVCNPGACCPSHPVLCSGLSGIGWLWWSAATPQESLRHVKVQRCNPGTCCPSHPVLFSGLSGIGASERSKSSVATLEHSAPATPFCARA